MKRVLGVLLICVALCIISTSVFAAPAAVSIDNTSAEASAFEEETGELSATVLSGKLGDNLSWTLSDDGVLVITGSGAMANCSNSSSSIPWYNSRDKITSVVISKGITSIGNYVFQGCRNLESVTIPDSVTSIGWYAFQGCTSLKSITIPDSVTSIGMYAFLNCSNLESVTIPDSVTRIESSAFYTCTNLKSITIPDSVTSIGDSAFRSCYGLESVTIGSGVTSIGSSAFYTCTNLKSVTIPDSVTRIGNSAFQDCTSLESVTIGSGVTSIGGYTFSGCGNLKSVYATDLKSWLGITFEYASSNPLCNAADLYIGKDKLTELVVPEGITAIKACAFYGYKGLESVKLSDRVTSIGIGAFQNCSNLESVTIPDSVTSIENYAFYECTNLKSVTIGSGVTSIGNGAFQNCKIKNITIPSSVTRIDANAFRGCESLEGITIPSSVTSIGDSAFRGCNGLESVTIPSTVTSMGGNVFAECENLKEAKFAVGSLTVPGYTFEDCAKLETVTIPKTVTSIGSSAFRRCTNLANVTIPKSVVTIGASAFEECDSITSIEIPGELTTLNGSTFKGCDSLESVKLPDSITHISNQVFYNCYSLAQINIPVSVNTVYESAFHGCVELKEAVFTDALTLFDYRVFEGCVSLEKVVFGKNIQTIRSDAFKNCPDLVIYGYAGTVAQSCAASYGLEFVDISPKSYTVTYHANGGVGEPAPQIKEEGKTINLSTIVPVLDGYTFLGWAKKSSATSIDYQAGEEYSEDADVTLYAVWSSGSAPDGVPVTGVVIDKTSLELKVGETATITVTVTPENADNKNVTWLSTDESVATVKGGVVTAVSEGTAAIVVTTVDGGKSAFCTVKVSGEEIPEAVPVSGISLNKTSLELEEGESETLVATVAPENADNKSVTWMSTDESVATVENGKVKAVSAGTAVIVVTTVDGGKSAFCTVKVSCPDVPEIPDEPDEPVDYGAVLTLSDVTGRAGEIVKVVVSLRTEEVINTIGIKDITYDKDVLTFIGFSDHEELSSMSSLSSFDEEKLAVVAALKASQIFDGEICTLNFKINENAEEGAVAVSATANIKLNSETIATEVVPAAVSVTLQILGDIDLNDVVDMNDAILLLQHSMFPELYPIDYSGSVDFTKDGNIDMNDAILLLQYSMFPELYPIN